MRSTATLLGAGMTRGCIGQPAHLPGLAELLGTPWQAATTFLPT
jgi:hypothetical protein